MEVKGSAVKSITDFIKKNHSDKYQEWLEVLPEESKKHFMKPILPSNWYPVIEAAVLPTEKLAELFFDNDPIKAAWESGRFSAETALTGLYKFFVKAASPHFIVGKAGKIFSTYYQPSEMSVVDKGEKWVKLHITVFETPSEIIEARIGGWIEKAMEISGCANVKVEITKSLARNDGLTELMVTWE